MDKARYKEVERDESQGQEGVDKGPSGTDVGRAAVVTAS